MSKRGTFAPYVKQARAILERNWSGQSTRPAPGLYPHQWNWDSGFIAMGYAHYDTRRAMRELESLFAAQWNNGMLPQIVFNPACLGHYFPEPDFWQTSVQAPPGILTSAITMPPVHAIAVEKIHRHAPRRAAVMPFIRRIYPKLLALHSYLYRERGSGALVYIRHPWESGIDNSPAWDEILARISIDPGQLPAYTRRDLEHGVDPAMRPSDDDYDRYVYLVDLFRRCGHDEARIRKVCPFLVLDPLFNSILCRADESLARLAVLIGADPAAPQNWARETARAIRRRLWNVERQLFTAYDLVADELVAADSAAGFLPLYAGAASREQARILYERLDSSSFCALHQGNCFTVPNYDMQGESFDRFNYWRGPVWININWLLAQGLRRYGYTLKADSLQKDLLQLPIRFGFHEYFDSLDGTGYGSDNFSWTAALFIDLVSESYDTAVHVVPRHRAAGRGAIILNHGDELPGCQMPELAAELMHSIKSLKDEFYDTGQGKVDYTRLKESDHYHTYRVHTNALRGFNPASIKGRRQKLAFWINLYNTIVIDGIIACNIESSVQEVPRFFRRIRYLIDGRAFAADDIEHGILRHNTPPPFSTRRPFGPFDRRRALVLIPVDPRIHFALVCGSRSCAPIDFYASENIDAQLELAARSFINSSEVLVLPEENKLLLSEIFRWYGCDFGGKIGVLDFIIDYMVDPGARRHLVEHGDSIRFEYLHYDWNLNIY